MQCPKPKGRRDKRQIVWNKGVLETMTKRKNESKEEYNERIKEQRKLSQRRRREKPGFREKERERARGSRKLLVLFSRSEQGCGWNAGVRISRGGKILPIVYNLRTHLESIAHAHRGRKGMGFHPISFEHEGCEWHHVNEKDVVQTPVHIHRIGSKLPKWKTEGVLG